jgi:hypothetical protein
VLSYNPHYTLIRRKFAAEVNIFNDTEGGPDHLPTFDLMFLGANPPAPTTPDIFIQVWFSHSDRAVEAYRGDIA